MVGVRLTANERPVPAAFQELWQRSWGGQTPTDRWESVLGRSLCFVLKLRPHLAPIKVAVLPLARNKPEITDRAKAIKRDLMNLGIGRVFYEDTGNIGKGYRRHDEVGTPFCVTVDFDTIGKGEDESLWDTVTVRDRDTMAQERVKISDLPQYLREQLRQQPRAGVRPS